MSPSHRRKARCQRWQWRLSRKKRTLPVLSVARAQEKTHLAIGGSGGFSGKYVPRQWWQRHLSRKKRASHRQEDTIWPEEIDLFGRRFAMRAERIGFFATWVAIGTERIGFFSALAARQQERKCFFDPLSGPLSASTRQEAADMLRAPPIPCPSCQTSPSTSKPWSASLSAGPWSGCGSPARSCCAPGIRRSRRPRAGASPGSAGSASGS